MIDKNTVCCFSGHRIIPKQELPQIETAVEKVVIELINQGVIFFGAGGALGFDMLAERVILRLREQYPIKLILVLPCPPEQQTLKWNSEQKDEYYDILNRADKVRIVSPNYESGCMLKRNRHLVDCSAYLICYLRQNSGGTYYTVNYAEKNGLTILRI